jgi:hypothetical protein
VFENGRELGPAHTLHATIRTSGAGRFSHWGSGTSQGLYFSASDNTNPKSNGRAYTYSIGTTPVITTIYPPDVMPSFVPMPSVPMPGYLSPIIDPSFGTRVTRIADQAAFGSTQLVIAHHYAKTQPWNCDGSLIMLIGSPAPILDGNTYQLIRTSSLGGEHRTWSNRDPRLVYAVQPPNHWIKVDALTNVRTTIRTFSQFSRVSYGSYEGNMSNDDRYVALQCTGSTGNSVIVYDQVADSIVSSLPTGSVWPNNVSMSQSGAYVSVQWGVSGFGARQGLDIYTRSLSLVRKLTSNGGGHYDLGYDTAGNEVCVITDIDASSRAIVAYRLDTGTKTTLLTDAQMSWYIHVSCRNTKRPGWAYLTEFADPNSQTTKPNYQLAFGVRIDGSQTVERFAHVHHSTTKEGARDPFGVPNRDGSRMMFRSDWENGTGPIYSYVAQMPVLAATAPIITAQPIARTVTAGQTATFSVSASGTGPLTYQWRRNATNIVGATSAAYTTAATTIADSGAAFSVIVRNSVGSVTSASATLTVTGVTLPPVGTGLTGQYFDNSNFTGASISRTDATVNFNWGQGSPTSVIGADTFSARWTGQVQAQYSQTYTFHVTGDDGVRLWVNGTLLINKWVLQSATEWSGSIALIAGTKYNIKLEYYENAGNAVAQLRWSSPSTAKAIIPSSQLYSASTPLTQQTFKASADFSGTQGFQNWSYLDSAGALLVYDSVNSTWKGVEAYLWIWAGGCHPGSSRDIVRRWTAPQAGTISITGSVRDLDVNGGAGIIAFIRKNGSGLWQTTIANGNTAGANFSLSQTVVAGDKIDFVVNRNGTNYYDSTAFDPTIVLTTSIAPMPTGNG